MLQPTLARTALNHCCRWRCLCSHAAVRGAKPGKNVQLQENEIRGLCLKSREIFLSQPILLELEAPLKICGKWDLYAYVKKNLSEMEYTGVLIKKKKMRSFNFFFLSWWLRLMKMKKKNPVLQNIKIVHKTNKKRIYNTSDHLESYFHICTQYLITPVTSPKSASPHSMETLITFSSRSWHVPHCSWLASQLTWHEPP